MIPYAVLLAATAPMQEPVGSSKPRIVQGVVVDAETKEPAAGVDVRLEARFPSLSRRARSRTVTGEDGRFGLDLELVSFGSGPAGALETDVLEAANVEHADVVVDFRDEATHRAASEVFDWDLETGGRIHDLGEVGLRGGHALELCLFADGEPLPDGVLVSGDAMHVSASTGQGGCGVLRGLPRIEPVFVWAPGKQARRVDPRRHDLDEVRLEDARILRVLVVDGTGAPAPSRIVDVEARGVLVDRPDFVRSDLFVLEGQLTGVSGSELPEDRYESYRVKASKRGVVTLCNVAAAQVEVAAGSEVSVVELEPRATTTIEIVLDRGR